MKNIFTLLLICLYISSFGQSYNDQFKKICEKGELLNSIEFLKKWKKTEPNNPEMFISLFNYYLIKSKSEIGDPNFLGGYILSSKNDSINIKQVTKQLKTSDSLFQLSQKYLNSGILKNPNRLDMHIGRLNTLKNKGKKNKLIESVKSLVQQNNINKGKWLWAENQISNRNEDEFIGLLQSYLYHIMTLNSPDFKEIMMISKLGLETYPSNHILLSNVGVCKLQFEEFKEAIKYFKKGIESKPNDIIIRFNIADAFTQIKKMNEARKHYEYIIENGDDKHSKLAKELIEKL